MALTMPIFAGTIYPDQTACGINDCWTIISNANLDNIMYSGDAITATVEFRDKTRPTKNFYYRKDPGSCKAMLSILLAAKSSGANIHMHISAGNMIDNGTALVDYIAQIDP